MIILNIPDVPPSLNVQRRMHFSTYRRLRKNWSLMVWAAMECRPPAEPLPFARITFTRHTSKLLDVDNLAGAFKPILDVLRPVSAQNPNGLGVIEDDDASHI